MVAGAAAGVAAIFKAPATGAIFAIEVPYQDELARRLLLPALVSAATGYLAFVAVDNTDRLFPIAGEPSFNFRDLIGALALGVAAGLAARAFASSVMKAKQLAESPSILRPLLAGALLAGIFVITRLATGESLTFGPGYNTIAWALDPVTERGSCCSCSCCASRRQRPSVAWQRAIFIPLVVGGARGRVIGARCGPQHRSRGIGVAADLLQYPLAAVCRCRTEGPASSAPDCSRPSPPMGPNHLRTKPASGAGAHPPRVMRRSLLGQRGRVARRGKGYRASFLGQHQADDAMRVLSTPGSCVSVGRRAPRGHGRSRRSNARHRTSGCSASSRSFDDGVDVGTSAPLAALLVVVPRDRGGTPEVSANRASARSSRVALVEKLAADAPAARNDSDGHLATLATHGVDALDGYFSRYLPQLVLAVIVPVAVIVAVCTADWISALIIAVTIPLIPIFMALIGMRVNVSKIGSCTRSGALRASSTSCAGSRR
jgi:hypothetical protein